MRSISVRQASVLLFLVLAGDVMVRPFTGGQNAAAATVIPIALAQGLFLYAIVFVLARIGMMQVMTAAALAVFGGVCLLEAAAVLLRTEQFYRYASDEPLPVAVTLGVLVLCVAYALLCHTRYAHGNQTDSTLHTFRFATMARAADVIFWLFAASLILLLVAGAPSMRLVQLAPAQGFPALWEELLKSLQVPAGLLVCLWLCKGEPQAVQRGFGAAIAGACGLRAVLAVFGELVLGTNAAMHPQLLHTLARVGGISVFKRLDALHVCVWVLVLLVRIVVLMTGAQMALALLWRCKNSVCVAVLCGALLPASAMMAAIPEQTHASVVSCGLLVCLIWTWMRGDAYAKGSA